MRKLLISNLMASSGVKFGTSGARGLISQMTDEVCYAYSAAFVQTVGSESKRVVLGHDLRPSSPRIAAACAAAIYGHPRSCNSIHSVLTEIDKDCSHISGLY